MSSPPAFPDPLAQSRVAPFECTLTAGRMRAAWVHVAGELDLCTSPQLERTLRAARLHARLIVLDARKVSFMDCSGVHAILAVNAGGDRDVPRLIIAPSGVVDRLLKLAGVRAQIWTIDIPSSEPEPMLGLLPEVPTA